MEGIGKCFGRQDVLANVRFELRAGEVHVLAGENGAGKSTLIKILAGVHREYEGAITLHGERVSFSSPQDAARRGISCIHQELSLIPGMSVADNIFLGRERSGVGGWMHFGNQAAACRQLLDQLGLNVASGRNVEDYPICVQQTIEIAKALAFDARIIIMDEPTSALTEPEVERLFATIDDLKRRGCGIIYISHKMEEIYRIADRISVLRDGRYVGTSEAAALPRAELIRWMVGRDVDEQFPRHAPQPREERLRVENVVVPDPGGLPRPAVDGVSLSVRAGEILGIGGLQGSGASELLGGLFGRYGRSARGQVWLNGKPFRPKSPGHSIRHGMALLTNDRKTSGLVLEMSVAENVTLASVPAFSPGFWMRFSREKQRAQAQREAFGIKVASLEQPVDALSGGNQQKVVLAKWLETEPKVLLLDEPTRGVDVGAKHEIYELMNRWSSEGIAILLITSEMPELLALSDRIVVMHRGRITAEFSREEATQEKVLDAAMGQECVL
jgi:ABC-type sugar transport system ATPase subunit